jgi:hypothetical protein
MAGKIQVFQDMAIHGAVEKRSQLRDALLATPKEPWHVDLDRSAEVSSNGLSPKEVILFRREGDEALPAAGLTLFETDDGYYVPNIVPLKTSSLTFVEYNKILNDFIRSVATPAAEKLGFSITTTSPEQTLEDWLPPEADKKLRVFSGSANKSTGSSHPSDKRRWLDFIVAVHRSKKKIDSGLLARWLHEAEGWREDSAQELAIEYEQALELLEFYDEH